MVKGEKKIKNDANSTEWPRGYDFEALFFPYLLWDITSDDTDDSSSRNHTVWKMPNSFTAFAIY